MGTFSFLGVLVNLIIIPIFYWVYLFVWPLFFDQILPDSCILFCYNIQIIFLDIIGLLHKLMSHFVVFQNLVFELRPSVQFVITLILFILMLVSLRIYPKNQEEKCRKERGSVKGFC